MKQSELGREKEINCEVVYMKRSNFIKSMKVTVWLVSGDVVVVRPVAKLLGKPVTI